MKKNLFGISLLTITGLYVLLSAIVILIVILLGYPPSNGILLSIFILIIQFMISPFLTDVSMKWFYNAKFDYELPDYLKQFIENICRENNMKYPRIGYIDDSSPNAFTYGHTKNDARIVLTKGIFELLTEDEVKTVVGHELGHAVHYDMLFMTMAQLVPLVLYFIYEVTILDNRSNNNKNSSYAELIGLIAYLFYLLSNYIILWLSRTREYYADDFSIKVTKNPNSLAQALVKIGYGLTTTADSNKKHSVSRSNALGIFDSKTSKTLVVSSYSKSGSIDKNMIKNAMKWEMWNPWAFIYQLNSTHPLISRRLLEISKSSKEYNQEPYIIFDLQKEESYVDDFLVEILINVLPFLSLIIALIISIILSMCFKLNSFILWGLSIIIVLFCFDVRLKRKYKNKDYKETNIKELLGEVKVSEITSIPCTIEGKIIGRGNPGCIFNEDFIIKDETGIIFLDYKQPLKLQDKIFALFKAPEYFNKSAKITGWYRRSPVPYIEINTIEVDGKVKRLCSYPLMVGFEIIFLLIGIALIIVGIF